MAATIVGALQPELQNLIKESKILLVGAGGIGCEVLKNLVLMGFGEVEVIDLDTIEVSNLNRQFLFGPESVGQPKAHVAKESVLKFNPNVNIISHYGDIMDPKYNATFFNKFKLVINALDNKKARSHVNRMCLSCNIPLIESGTMGYSGQVEFIKKGLSLCYECLQKPEPKSYPMCTIRNTPKEPIHCIIWAKYLFSQLFGENSEEDVSMEVVSQDNVNQSDKNCPNKLSMSAREWVKLNDYDPLKCLKKIFCDDVEYLLNMSDLYKDKNVKPVPLDSCLITHERSEYIDLPDDKVLSLKQYITMFLDSVAAIKEKIIKSKEPLVWDKDDDDFMNFVVSCANIRSHIFCISFKSHFDIKSMAGNIIPAIATANTMVAGQIVIHALKALMGKYDKCQSVFLRELPNHKGKVLVKDKILLKPNPKCNVCSAEGEIVLSTDMSKFTLKQFHELILKNKLCMVQPEVILNDSVIFSSDDTDEVNLLSSVLHKVPIFHGALLTVEDYFQDYKINIKMYHKEKTNEEDPEFEIFGNLDDMKNKITNKNKVDEEKKNICVDNPIENNDIVEIPADNNVDSYEKEVDKKEKIEISSKCEVTDENDEAADVLIISDEEDKYEDTLAIKRKAADHEQISEPKKSRVGE